jgi:DNA-binding MarR family transcriptional regulator
VNELPKGCVILPNNQELLIELLRKVNRNLGEEVKNVLYSYNLGVTNMIIARRIKSEPGITISELARRTGIAKSHISNTIKELKQREWVEMQTDANDQRLLRLYVTKSADNQLELVRLAIRQRLSGIFSGLSETRKAEIIDSIQEILNALEQAKVKGSNND